MNSRTLTSVGSVAKLSDYGFGPVSLGWWGVVGFMLIEGMGFVLAIGAYYYLLPNETVWPPTAPAPPLLWGTAFTALALLSELPNTWYKRKAHQLQLREVRIGLTVVTVLGVLLLVLRGFEFHAMNVRWDRSAYGSIVWALLLLHTFHTVTDVWDTGVLAVLSWFKKFDGRKFSDATDNALYWHFIVWSWVVLYVVIYWTPRWV